MSPMGHQQLSTTGWARNCVPSSSASSIGAFRQQLQLRDLASLDRQRATVKFVIARACFACHAACRDRPTIRVSLDAKRKLQMLWMNVATVVFLKKQRILQHILRGERG